jgi:acetoin utilization deacetylase AcuC-like enzyme
MTDLKILRHPCFADHIVPIGHPERPDRIRTINAMLESQFSDCYHGEPPAADLDHLRLVHESSYVDAIFQSAPEEGLVHLDGDTVMSPHSLAAALAGAGGAVEATRQVLTGEAGRVFVASRPPGHHAEPAQAMGFCLFSNAAIAAKYAIAIHGLDRVAVVDFDVHHGNGTQAAFWSDSHTIFASSHQMPLYPGTGAKDETGVGNIFNAPIAAGTDGDTITRIWQDYLLPKVAAMAPELIIISAGFDAHRLDPLGGLNMEAEDFANITRMIRNQAEDLAHGRIVSILEGGYDLDGLRDSAAAHLEVLR